MSFLKELFSFKGYALLREREQYLDFRRRDPATDRLLPDPVELGRFRIIFTERVGSGYRVNVFEHGQCVAKDVRLKRGVEKDIKVDNKGIHLMLKVGLLDNGVLRVSEVRFDEE